MVLVAIVLTLPIFATERSDIVKQREDLLQECALAYAQVARTERIDKFNSPIDSTFVHQMEKLTRGRIPITRKDTEYQTLAKTFVDREYSLMPPKLKAIIDQIRREGKIPIFRAIRGEWTPSDEKNPFIREGSVSTSLALTPAIDVALSGLKPGDTTPVTFVICSWDGKRGEAGVDPLEIVLAILTLEPEIRGTFQLNRQIQEYYETNLAGILLDNTRKNIWPALLEQIPKVLPPHSH
jgi:hypothetical protein